MCISPTVGSGVFGCRRGAIGFDDVVFSAQSQIRAITQIEQALTDKVQACCYLRPDFYSSKSPRCCWLNR